MKRGTDALAIREKMRVYEATITYSLVSLGENTPLSTPGKVVEYLESAIEKHPLVEGFYAIFLDRKNRPIGRHLVTLGTATAALAHPREIFRPAVLANACAIICAHNHPSGDPAPSGADAQITRLLREASKTMEIPLVDHVVIGHKEADPLGVGYFSFRDAGLI